MKVYNSELPTGSSGYMILHIQKTKHNRYKIFQKKKDKLRGIYCETCKKFITPIRLVSK